MYEEKKQQRCYTELYAILLAQKLENAPEKDRERECERDGS